jgi:prolyl-tRNA editing enzyme YbaK/EbsC (Cys-tRNA(Pro) deacylase)
MTESLVWVPAVERLQLLACPVRKAIENEPSLAGVEVAEIDPAYADTEALCGQYDVDPGESANCVVVAGRRGEAVTFAACLLLASTRADVNGVVRRHLGARKASFAPMDTAVGESGMEYGGITPIGLPPGWPLLIDAAVADSPYVVIGSGRRRGKLLVPGKALAGLPGAVVLEGLGVAV